MYDIPSSSRLFVGKKCSGVHGPFSERNAVRSPNQAKGMWKKSSTPFSRR